MMYTILLDNKDRTAQRSYWVNETSFLKAEETAVHALMRDTGTSSKTDVVCLAAFEGMQVDLYELEDVKNG